MYQVRKVYQVNKVYRVLKGHQVRKGHQVKFRCHLSKCHKCPDFKDLLPKSRRQHPDFELWNPIGVVNRHS